MPSGVLNYEKIKTLAQGTLQKYLTRPGSKYGIINEARPKTLVGGKLFNRTKLGSWDGGTRLAYDLMLKRSRVGQWVGPTTKIALKATQETSRASVPRRFYAWGFFKSYAELDHNKGEKEVVVDLLKQSKEDLCVDIISEFEDQLWALDGNYAHDGSGADFLLPFGMKYWFTIDGLHITGTGSIAGIDPTTEPLWRNPFINPVTASDGMDAVTSVFELREAYQRMLRMLRWPSVKVWGPLAKDIVDDGENFDPDGPENPKKDFMICCDPKTQVKYQSVVLDREDNVTADLGRERPMFKGIPMEDCDQLGYSSYGFGYDAAGNLLGTAHGSYTAGLFPNTGESLFLNANLVHVLTHSNHAPFVKKPYEPEGMFGLAFEGDFWLQTAVRSRRRGGGYIGGYAFS
jgi:hypothetical protein